MTKTNKLVIDLDGPMGNAFGLIGMARRLCDDLGLKYETVKVEMIHGDYGHLVQVFEKYFNKVVTLKGRGR